jgi:predicted nucleic acid-binding protein
VSRPILLEYQDLLSRPELKIRRGLRQLLMQFIRSHSYSVVPKSQSRITPDPGDDKFLECADAARADYLVTGQRHFPMYWKGTKVITFREFIRLVGPHLLP